MENFTFINFNEYTDATGIIVSNPHTNLLPIWLLKIFIVLPDENLSGVWISFSVFPSHNIHPLKGHPLLSTTAEPRWCD